MKRIIKFIGVLLGLVFAGVASIVWYYTPAMLPFPEPKGEYSVGTRSYHWIDANRVDPFNQTKQRELMVQWWYPTDIETQKFFPYVPDKILIVKQREMEGNQYIPGFIWDRLLKITTSNIPDAPLASCDKQFPIIVMSHGYGGYKEQYTAFAQELASHGYVVVGVDHTGLSDLVLFPDGRIGRIASQLKALEEGVPSEEKDKIAADAYKQGIPDISFVIDKIIQFNNDIESPFYKKIDVAHIGVMGHSMGGCIALGACRHDDRCKAAVSMDLWRPDVNSVDPIKKPCLILLGEHGFMMLDDPWFKTQRGLMEKFCTESGPRCSIIMIPGAGHHAFCDLILLKKPIPYLMGITTCAGDQYMTLDVILDHIRTFFDRTLTPADTE